MVEYSKDKGRKAQCAMVHLTAKTETELKQLLDELIQSSVPIFDNKLKRVILFGSYARGDYDEESDIDVMFLIDDEANILSRKYRKPVRRIIADIDLKYGVLLCSVLQNEHDFYTCINSIPFYYNVEKEGITLYGQQQTPIL
jgi:predicted nucleotidyltransferase